MSEPTNNKASEKSLDALFAAAEREPGAPKLGPTVIEGALITPECGAAVGGSPQLTQPKADKPKPCIHTEALPHKVCPLCHWPFCPDCASSIDADYCMLCLTMATAELISKPLVDEDGVTHEGRVLTPGPMFGTFAKGVSEMSMSELEQHVEKFKHLIKQAEVGLDFYRVGLATLQMEHGQRKEQQRRRLRGVKIAKPKPSADPTKPAKPAVDMSRMIKMIEALQQLQKLKKTQPQQPAAATTNKTEVKS